ncbi:hypothetical protein B0T16DRAFT_389884 [Cercophora newfieldiana]|uniref:Uncharacterized protein n=1 Tax=Cercophora newfieldiana TaxID=92897 RepID=A0AA40CSJ3_9PEZI|nr:hypothetical protein B0T16DRAFT_389884 [Cercophora newfieldiana]
MRTITVFCLLLSSIAGVVQGFAEAGAYERALFYYAYLLDLEKNGGNFARKLAIDCKPEPCDIDQFLKYISKKAVTPKLEISNKKPPAVPDIKELVDELTKEGNEDLTKEINVDKAIKGLKGSAKYTEALVSVTEFVKANAQLSDNEALKEGVRNALRGAALARKEAMTKSFFEDSNMKTKYKEQKTYLAPLYDGAKEGEKAKIISFYDTSAYNSKGINDLKADFEKHTDQAHRGNLEVLENAFKEYSEKCPAR